MQPEINVGRLIQHDRREYAALVEAYTDKLYRMALRMTGNEQDAEDVLQETFIKVFRNIEGFKGNSSLSTWIYRIAMNEAFMLLRKHKPEGYSLDDDHEDDDLTPREVASWDPLPEESLMSMEMNHHLSDAILRLPETLRGVFLLRDTEHLSVKETADALGITEGTVKIRLLRARLKLREYLNRYFREPGKENIS
ncbi:MAG: sigma-70 family RNA polymerase sigma factor [Anaerolineaceae bacterium]|nr:sigma-70 family RNA polymerase sigma factor [Anaerolineaceae bacterium]MBN2676833.1 sigma-70 family RNA polymerase sigma factor [Anaerolineaceae bacterium]